MRRTAGHCAAQLPGITDLEVDMVIEQASHAAAIRRRCPGAWRRPSARPRAPTPTSPWTSPGAVGRSCSSPRPTTRPWRPYSSRPEPRRPSARLSGIPIRPRRSEFVMSTERLRTRPRTLVEKIWDDHVVAERARRARRPLRRPAPRPRGDQPAGVHRPARSAACASAARTRPSRRRTTRSPTHDRAACRSLDQHGGRPGPAARPTTAREFGIPLHGLGSARPGHRPRHRAGARA